MNACPSCGGQDLRRFYEAREVPVHSVLLLDSREEAVSFPRGDITLDLCRDCGLIFNASFDPARLGYGQRYEETQGFSPTFQAWHRALAERLVERHGLRGKRVLEIGCGKGEFLTMLCEMGPNRGVGFDPAYVASRNPGGERVRFVTDFYDERYAGEDADFVCCKMTLEHIIETGRFVGGVRSAIGERHDTVVFFQVPDAQRILEEQAFWDIYYEHCSYFTAPSLAWLFRHAGFEVMSVGREYGDQYLAVEARPNGRLKVARDPAALCDLERMVDGFEASFAARIKRWRGMLQDAKGSGRRVVVWGSGSKGVAFLTTLAVPGAVDLVVDINPHRHGHFMPGTGQRIVGPDFLEAYQPDAVIVMNPIYLDEIRADLSGRGLAPEVLVP